MKFITTKKTKQKKFLYQYEPRDIKKIKIPLILIIPSRKYYIWGGVGGVDGGSGGIASVPPVGLAGGGAEG